MYVKPITAPFVTPITGVSFRQENVRKLNEGDQVYLHRDPANPFDPNAIRVETRAGDHLGFIPKHISARLAASPAPRWSGTVTDVLRNETWGIRVRVIPVESPEPDLPEVHMEAPTAAAPDPEQVLSITGRSLGTLARLNGDLVLVHTPEGDLRAYPADRVTVGAA